jgi:hypothetical protein
MTIIKVKPFQVLATAGLALVLMMGIAIGAAGTGATANAAVPSANPLPGWLHKEGQYFTYWLPTKDWQAVETNRGLDITSPTGLYAVGFGWSSLAMPTTTSQVFQTIMSGHAQDFKQWKALQTSPVTNTAMGTRQVMEFTAMHKYPLQGWKPVRGVMIADALDTGMGSYGLDATLMYAPAAEWSKQMATLDRIRTNITTMHG